MRKERAREDPQQCGAFSVKRNPYQSVKFALVCEDESPLGLVTHLHHLSSLFVWELQLILNRTQNVRDLCLRDARSCKIFF
jgi:hypothetical protein